MSLLVCTYKIDPKSKNLIFDPLSDNGEELAGFENWRSTVWGSEETINLGAKFLPRLKETDLYLEKEDLIEFIKECQMLIEHYEDRSIRFRLNNFIKAANKAILYKGGVLIN